MGLMDIFRRSRSADLPTETRSSGSGYTAQIMAARAAYLTGSSGIGEMTAAAQACIGLWESAFGLADVEGTTLLSRGHMALAGRALALRGNAVFLIRDNGLVPCIDWEIRTRDSVPRAYRVTVPETAGGRSEVALAAEVLHFRIGCDVTTPWHGTAPLRRAQITAATMQAIEDALCEVYSAAPLGSQIVPYPEAGEAEKENIGRAFRGSRGKVILRESVVVSAAGGPAPQQDWQPRDLTPDLQRAMPGQSLAAAQGAIMLAFGVLPALVNEATTGPVVREAQRHLAGWQLQPIAEVMAEEASQKLGGKVTVDVGRPLQAFDAGGRARALSQLIEAMGRAKELGLTPEQVSAAIKATNWGGGDDLA